MDHIESITSELLVRTSLEDLRVSGAMLRKEKWELFAENLIGGELSIEDDKVATDVKRFAAHVDTFRKARQFFVGRTQTLAMCCEALGMDLDAVRDKLRPETMLEFNTLQAANAAQRYMDFRKKYVGK